MTSDRGEQRLPGKTNILSLTGIDYIELYVGNALQAAHFYRTAFGFAPIAFQGLETGVRDRVSYIMHQEACFFILTAPLNPRSPIAEHVRLHGDGIKDIAFRVTDVAHTFEQAVRGGAQPLLEPTRIQDEAGTITKATVGVYGNLTHSFIQRDAFVETLLPCYQPLQAPKSVGTGLTCFDHFAVSLPAGGMQPWVDFYTDVFGFEQIHEENIVTEYSAMNSKAVQDNSQTIKFVLVEPISGKRRSQVEEFLAYHHGPGIQHVALHTDDIIRTIHNLQANGVSFVAAPKSYYEMLPDRIKGLSEDITALREVNVLADQDEWGYLLQIFSRPVQDRPTLFIEIIQRKQARGFGGGNIKALFEALELEQARRGNL